MQTREQDEKFLQIAIDLSLNKMNEGHGGPFGAIIVCDEEIIAEGWNQVTSTNDPTAHAEMVAIRKACNKVKHFELKDCVIYTSCEPCPMCLGGIYWARFKRVVYANTREDAKNIGFDDGHIYDEIASPHSKRKIEFCHCPSTNALNVFNEWTKKNDKIDY